MLPDINKHVNVNTCCDLDLSGLHVPFCFSGIGSAFFLGKGRSANSISLKEGGVFHPLPPALLTLSLLTLSLPMYWHPIALLSVLT